MEKRICLIIPCFNEEEMINKLYLEVNKVVEMLQSYNFTYLFVNDGSKDQTLALIKQLATKDQRVKYISFSRNFGKESSMLAGLEAAHKLKFDACLLMDADLQDPPSIMIDFFKYYEEGYKYIYARNKTRKGQAFLKKEFSKAFYKIYAWFTGDKNSVSGARDFALLDKDVITAFLEYKDNRRYSKGISSQIGFKRKCVDYDYHEREAGTTKWSFRSLFKYAMTGIEQFSRIYEIVPNIVSLLLLLSLTVQLVFLFFNPYPLIGIYIALNIGFLFTNIVLKFILKVQYDIRDQILVRPPYLTEETNITQFERK